MYLLRINKFLKDSRCSKRTAKRFPATLNTAINTSHCVPFAFRLYNDAQWNKRDFNRSLRDITELDLKALKHKKPEAHRESTHNTASLAP